jgi:hypothetical protein
VKEAFFVNNVMAGAALINGAVFIVSSFINVANYLPHTSTASYMGSLFSSASLLLKEVPGVLYTLHVFMSFNCYFRLCI